MPRLDWARLPSAACFTRMLLEPNQCLRGSGDDLRNFYYTLRLPPGWVRFNSVRRRVAKHVAHHGGDVRLCFRVSGVGDRNGCAIAQATKLFCARVVCWMLRRLSGVENMHPGEIYGKGFISMICWSRTGRR